MNEIKSRVKGKIIHLNKGWGFITSREIEYERIFFHWSALVQGERNFNELEIGMECVFDCAYLTAKNPGEKDKGWRAMKISIINEE